MSKEIDPIILGDNQFFGVNHMSEDKGRETLQKFKDLEEIRKTLYFALDKGVRGVMFSTNAAIYQITDMMRKDAALKRELSIYVNVPGITKYVSMLSQMGAYETVQTVLKGKSVFERIAYFTKTALNVILSDYLAVANRLIDAEMAPFYDLNVKAIFLHNALCDLAAAYNMPGVVSNYDNYISKRYGVIPAYGTWNYPLFTELLDKASIKNSLIMTPVNKKGFLMNPSRQLVEEAIARAEHTVLAMVTLASGRLRPSEAYEYLFSIRKVKNVVVGLSSKRHADETFEILNRFIGTT